jgi:hypothetical protein
MGGSFSQPPPVIGRGLGLGPPPPIVRPPTRQESGGEPPGDKGTTRKSRDRKRRGAPQTALPPGSRRAIPNHLRFYWPNHIVRHPWVDFRMDLKHHLDRELHGCSEEEKEGEAKRLLLCSLQGSAALVVETWEPQTLTFAQLLERCCMMFQEGPEIAEGSGELRRAVEELHELYVKTSADIYALHPNLELKPQETRSKYLLEAFIEALAVYGEPLQTKVRDHRPNSNWEALTVAQAHLQIQIKNQSSESPMDGVTTHLELPSSKRNSDRQGSDWDEVLEPQPPALSEESGEEGEEDHLVRYTKLDIISGRLWELEKGLARLGLKGSPVANDIRRIRSETKKVRDDQKLLTIEFVYGLYQKLEKVEMALLGMNATKGWVRVPSPIPSGTIQVLEGPQQSNLG